MELDRKQESRINEKLKKKSKLQDGFKGGKTVNEVLDKSAMLTIYRMINLHVISHVNGVVKAGKESVVFWAKGDGKDIALKVYLVSTSNFKKRWPYITGDRRFGSVKKGTRNIVNLWARKEFRNMSQCYDAGIRAPRPVRVLNNVLAMEFIGNNGMPAKTLLESKVEMSDYDDAVSILRDMYRKARLVHGDYSEYNIFKSEDGITVFDLGSAVDVRHPGALQFLKRDVSNITRFFVKRGMSVPNPKDAYEAIIN